MSGAADAPPAPALRRLAGRLAWTSAVGGVLLGFVLALLGVGAAAGGGELLVSLLPAIVGVGLGMAVPPFLFALAAVAVTGRRSAGAEMIASSIGAVIGAFVSPIVFYPASAALGLTVGLVIAVLAGAGYPFLVRALWRRSRPS